MCAVDTAEGADASEQRGDGGYHPATAPDQHGNRSVGDGQGPQREKTQRAREIQLTVMARRNGQHLERDGGARYHLIGAFGVESHGSYVQQSGDGEEKSQHPLTYPGSVIH
jgi:hypothetical protein